MSGIVAWLWGIVMKWLGRTQAKADSADVLARERDAANAAPADRRGVIDALDKGKF